MVFPLLVNVVLLLIYGPTLTAVKSKLFSRSNYMIFLKGGSLLTDHFYNFFIGFFSQFAQPRLGGSEGCNGKCTTTLSRWTSLGTTGCGLLCGDKGLGDRFPPVMCPAAPCLLLLSALPRVCLLLSCPLRPEEVRSPAV